MHYSTLRVLCLLPLLALVSLSAKAEFNITWQNQADYIGLRTLDGAANHSHPKTVAVETLARMLSQVQVKDSPYNPSQSLLGDESENLQRVFTDREIELLATKINQALVQANTNESVVFSVSDFRPSYIGRQRLSVSGTAYIKGDRFNLLLGEMHVDMQLKKLRSGVTGTYGKVVSKAEILRDGLNTGNLQKTTAHDWQLMTFAGAQAVNGRTDWLSIDLNRTYEYAIVRNEKKRIDDKYLTEQQQEVSNEALEARIKKLEQLEQEQQPAPQASGIEARLRKLQALYDSGALPEAVYLEKVRAIMSEL
ncbi:hypothetical protein ACFVYJ_13420 [Pontibacter sp. JAM-7]|uniref:hypothetical protein n=1 Tax=Pontibacter sp. JAM-7 TaxID=3366581 RepID=UPI003AF66ADA